MDMSKAQHSVRLVSDLFGAMCYVTTEGTCHRPAGQKVKNCSTNVGTTLSSIRPSVLALPHHLGYVHHQLLRHCKTLSTASSYL